jgi:hypothetical protein
MSLWGVGGNIHGAKDGGVGCGGAADLAAGGNGGHGRVRLWYIPDLLRSP